MISLTGGVLAKLGSIVLVTCGLLVSCITVASADSHTPKSSLVVIANERDPDSVRVARYYLQQRGLSERQLAYISLDPDADHIRPRDFIGAKTILDISIPANTEFLVLTWSKPYRVGCMSITSAFAFDYNEAFCSRKTCSPTAFNGYFDSGSGRPYRDFGIRPTMMLAHEHFNDATALIDRGVRADGLRPKGAAYLLSTNDRHRNVRALHYHEVKANPQTNIKVQILSTDAIRDRQDIMFYFTGIRQVADLFSNRFLPGAIGDHLTSAGGVLFGSSQMSILRWLQAGATGSYGTVVEPCNFPQKFPDPEVLVRRYTAGETLIEAYWKSVAWPGEGLFVGEPLSAPFAAFR